MVNYQKRWTHVLVRIQHRVAMEDPLRMIFPFFHNSQRAPIPRSVTLTFENETYLLNGEPADNHTCVMGSDGQQYLMIPVYSTGMYNYYQNWTQTLAKIEK